jgi:mannose-6-phosphate isomerase-like protein (cupin superfamily)
MNEPIHLRNTLHSAQLSPWQELPVARINNHQLLLIQAKGEYPWHQHDERDDGFLVLSGCLGVELPNKTIMVGAGELCVVPKGMPHRTFSDDGAQVLLFEQIVSEL